MKIQALAPTRISLFGGGTDMPMYAEKYGGVCISMAINLRQRITIYTDDDMWEMTGPNIFPPFADPQFLYAFLNEFKIGGGHHSKLECSFDGLIGNGLGGSASAAVAMVGAINKRLKLNMSRQDIAQKAWGIESKMNYTGKQDHWAATYGGLNIFRITNKAVYVESLSRDIAEELINSFVLFYTGIKRKPKIQEGFRELSHDQVKTLDIIKDVALNAYKPILNLDIREIANYMDYSWKMKKESNVDVSNSEIDTLYDRVKDCGALGAKILGSGGGGYMLAIVEPEKREQFIKDANIEAEDISVDFNGLEVREI